MHQWRLPFGANRYPKRRTATHIQLVPFQSPTHQLWKVPCSYYLKPCTCFAFIPFMDGLTIPGVTGVTIDSRLNFSSHLEHINSKLAQLSGITWRISFKLNINAAKTFYFSFVFSLLSYGTVAWGGVLLTYKCPRLRALFKRIICYLFGWHFPGNSFDSICRKLGLLTPIDIYKFNIMTMYINLRKGDYLPRLQFESRDIYYSDRRQNELRVPFPRTNAMKICYAYCIPMIWNSIPSVIRGEPRVGKFRAEYKKYLLNNVM